jgi:hypothetical protein
LLAAGGNFLMTDNGVRAKTGVALTKRSADFEQRIVLSLSKGGLPSALELDA